MKKRRNSKKGELLIETVVAMAVFAIMVTSAFRAYKSFSAVGQMESAYIYFESVCKNIDSYYDNLGRNYWAQKFFGKEVHFMYGSDYGYQKYDSNFNLISSNDPVYEYVLTYEYEGDNMYVSIENTELGKFVIEKLNYGPSLSSSQNDTAYYQDIMDKNVGINQLDPDEELEEDEPGDY